MMILIYFNLVSGTRVALEYNLVLICMILASVMVLNILDYCKAGTLLMDIFMSTELKSLLDSVISEEYTKKSVNRRLLLESI